MRPAHASQRGGVMPTAREVISAHRRRKKNEYVLHISSPQSRPHSFARDIKVCQAARQSQTCAKIASTVPSRKPPCLMLARLVRGLRIRVGLRGLALGRSDGAKKTTKRHHGMVNMASSFCAVIVSSRRSLSFPFKADPAWAGRTEGCKPNFRDDQTFPDRKRAPRRASI